MDREAQIVAFLAAHGWGAATREPLSGDASFRRYERLRGGARPALLMDAPPSEEDVRPYVTVARHLTAMGLSAPTILAADEAAGLLVIEDFGDATYTAKLADGADETPLYALAVDVLVDLHRHAEAAAVDVPVYSETDYLDEAGLFVDWYLPEIAGAPTAPAVRDEYLDLWRAALAATDGGPTSLVLRDYHVDNLMWLESRTGVARCGLLDFQDARIGPVAYDLVSLLEDARRDVPDDLITTMTDRYLAAFPDLDRERFVQAAATLSAQRNCKIIGIFTRLLRRDGKPSYLPHIPRVWRWLERDLAHPALEPLRAFLDDLIPAGDRRVPRVEPAS